MPGITRGDRGTLQHVTVEGLARVFFLAACLLALGAQIHHSISKYREHGTVMSLESRSYNEDGFPLPAVTLCAAASFNSSASHKRSELIDTCIVSKRSCTAETDQAVRWTVVRELKQICFTAYPQIRGDRRSKYNGYFFRLRFSKQDQKKGKLKIYLHDSTDGEARSPFFVHGESKIEVSLGSLVLLELRVKQYRWLDGYQRRCRDDQHYHRRACINRCYERAVKRALGYSCGLDWFLEKGTCTDPNQIYNITKYIDEHDEELLKTTDCSAQCVHACHESFFGFSPFSRTGRPVYRRQNVSKLGLSFRDSWYTVAQEKVVYDYYTLFGKISGALSLFLGVSLTACMDGAAKVGHIMLRPLRP